MVCLRTTALILCATLCHWTVGCGHITVEPTTPERETPRWMRSSLPEPRGVVLLIHGLNARPSTMDEIGFYLTNEGFHSYRMVLYGHSNDEATPFPTQQWRDDVTQAYTLAQITYPSLPIHIVAFSAGGLLATEVVAKNPQIQPASMTLLAPALSLRTYVQFVSLLSIFPPLSWRIRNLAPADYSRFSTTPLFWYTNILDSYDETRTLPHPERLRKIPTTVFGTGEDELISLAGITGWVIKHDLQSSWRVVELSPTPTDGNTFKHLIIDERSLGKEEWKRMMNSIVQLFSAMRVSE